MTNKRRKPKPVFIKIVGLILSESYQRCRLFAERLHKHHSPKFLRPSVTGLLDMDWTEYIGRLRRKVGGVTWSLESVVVFLDDVVLGEEPQLFRTFGNYFYRNPSVEEIKEHARREYEGRLNKGNLIYTYMELSLGGEYMGTLLFELRHDWLPKSSMWFAEFCTHERFSYVGAKIARVCKGGWLQSGEMVHQKLWSLNFLDDENYCYKHDRRGILSFANDGKHRNKFQFTVTFSPAEWMDGRYVAFGRVVEGADVLRRIEHTPCTYESPVRDITITACGMAAVGLGRVLDPTLRLKGITVGAPHLHLEFFVELLFHEFDRVLFERMDSEAKRLAEEGEWISDLMWKKVLEVLSKNRPPFEDIVDPRDRSSQYYLAERYEAGLYSLQDIPDLFIRRMLDEVVRKAVEGCDVIAVARSIVDFLVNAAFDEANVAEQVAEGIVQSLVQEVLKAIFGSESSLDAVGAQPSLSTASGLKTSLTDFIKRAGLAVTNSHSSRNLQEPSVRESVMKIIRSVLLEIVQNIDGGGQ